MEKFRPNLEYFTLPKSNFFNNLVLSKYDFSPTELYSKTPCIYLSPKTDDIDKNLIRKCIKEKRTVGQCAIVINRRK